MCNYDLLLYFVESKMVARPIFAVLRCGKKYVLELMKYSNEEKKSRTFQFAGSCVFLFCLLNKKGNHLNASEIRP